MKTRHLSVLIVVLTLTLSGCSKEDLLKYGGGKKDDHPAGAIFTMTNDPNGNQVVAYRRAANGTLEMIGAYATGGTGANLNEIGSPFFNDPLGTQDPLILSSDRRLLFAVNAGSNSLSSLRLTRSGGLRLTDEVPSGGVTPVSITTHHDLLYVAHAGDGGSISGFYVMPDGQLKSIPGATKPLSGSAAPGGIVFSADGQYLVVTEKNTNLLTVYAIDRHGKPSDPVSYPSEGVTPFGATVTKEGILLVSEAFGGMPDASAVSSYQITKTGELSPVTSSAATSQTAACWIELSDDEQYAYSSNTPSGTLSSFRVGRDGSLTLTESIAGEVGAGAFLLDTEITDGYLYVVAGAQEEIIVFSAEEGQLTLVERIANNLFEVGQFTGLAGF